MTKTRISFYAKQDLATAYGDVTPVWIGRLNLKSLLALAQARGRSVTTQKDREGNTFYKIEGRVFAIREKCGRYNLLIAI